MRVTPIGADLLFELDSGRKLIAVWGGVGCGKSYAIAQVCLHFGTTRFGWDHVEQRVRGPVDILVTGRWQTDLHQNLKEGFREIIEAAGGRWIDDSKWPRWELPNGATITWLHYQCWGEARSTIEGRGYHLLLSDETSQLEDTFWAHSFERARKPSIDVTGHLYPGQVVWISRPAAADGYIREAHRRIEDGENGVVLYARTRDNLWNGPDYIESIRRGRSKAEFEAITQEVVGATFPSRGAIYDDWTAETWPAGNLVDLDGDPEHPTIMVVDPGVLHTSVIWAQVHELAPGHPALVVVDEWHPHGRPTSVQGIIAEARRRPWQLSEVIIDPAAGARTRTAHLTSEVDVIARDEDEDVDGLGGGLGVPVRASIPPLRRPVFEGIMRVKARMCSAAGERTLVMVRPLWDEPPHVHGVRHSVQSYAWDERTGQPKKGRAGDQADHCADTLRYLVCHHAWDGPPELEPELVARPEPLRIPRRFAAGPAAGGRTWRGTGREV